MRSLKLTLGMLLLFPFTQQLAAGEAEDLMNFYGWWEGTWTVTATEEGSSEAQENEMKINRRDGNCLLVQGGGTSIWGYDAKRKKWVGTAFHSDGAFRTTILDRHQQPKVTPGTKVRATSKVKLPDGTVATGEENWHFIDADTAEITVKLKSESGEALPTSTFHCKRKKLPN